MNSWRSVGDLRSDLPGVLARFRAGQTFALSVGDGGPEAVMLTYDEFEDLDGEEKVELPDEVRSRPSSRRV